MDLNKLAESLDPQVDGEITPPQLRGEEEMPAIANREATNDGANSLSQQAEITTEQISPIEARNFNEQDEEEKIMRLVDEKTSLVNDSQDESKEDEEKVLLNIDSAGNRVKIARQVVEINNTRALDAAHIEEQLFKERLAGLKISETLLTSFKEKANYLNLSQVDAGYDMLEGQTKAKLDLTIESQTKIYNKMLWINILAEKMTSDNDPKTLEFDGKTMAKKSQEFQKFEIEVVKSKGYLDALSNRMKRVEKELDAYFYKLLKTHQMTENNLI